MKSDGSFLGYKQKPVPGSTPEPLNNFKVERKSPVGEMVGEVVGEVGVGVWWLRDGRVGGKKLLYGRGEEGRGREGG